MLTAVCKRWGQLALSPQLLRDIAAYFSGVTEGKLARMRSFCCWLARVAPVGPVEQLALHVDLPYCQGPADPGGTLTTLAAALAVCGSAGLQQLQLDVGRGSLILGSLILGSWAGMFGSRLRRLRIECDNELVVAASLADLSALESLELLGEADWCPQAQLPASLTELRLVLHGSDRAPLQVSTWAPSAAGRCSALLLPCWGVPSSYLMPASQL